MRSRDARGRDRPTDRAVPFGATLPARRELLRRRASLRPLWFSLPLVVVALLAGGFLIALPVWSATSGHAYRQGAYQRAYAGYERQEAITARGPEAWVARYNAGTTLLAQGRVDAGVHELERAMDGVPRAHVDEAGFIEMFSYECRVRMNLGLGLERQGDARMRRGEFSAAADLYRRGAALVAPCQSPSSTPSGEPQSGPSSEPTPSSSNPSGSPTEEPQAQDPGRQAGDAKDRLDQKERRARERESGTPTPTPSSSSSSPSAAPRTPDASPSPTPTPSGESREERERRERLEQRNRDAQERQREQQEQQNRDQGSRGW